MFNMYKNYVIIISAVLVMATSISVYSSIHSRVNSAFAMGTDLSSKVTDLQFMDEYRSYLIALTIDELIDLWIKEVKSGNDRSLSKHAVTTALTNKLKVSEIDDSYFKKIFDKLVYSTENSYFLYLVDILHSFPTQKNFERLETLYTNGMDEDQIYIIRKITEKSDLDFSNAYTEGLHAVIEEKITTSSDENLQSAYLARAFKVANTGIFMTILDLAESDSNSSYSYSELRKYPNINKYFKFATDTNPDILPFLTEFINANRSHGLISEAIVITALANAIYDDALPSLRDWIHVNKSDKPELAEYLCNRLTFHNSSSVLKEQGIAQLCFD